MSKKLLFIGNMNNNFFSVVRYLIDKGYSADLLIFKNEPDYFHPEMDTFNDAYKLYTKGIGWSTLPTDFIKADPDDIRAILDKYDVLIGCGPAPAYVNKSGRYLDMFIPYGGDIFLFPFLHPNVRRKVRKLVKQYLFARNQRLGIRNAKYILSENTNSEYEKIFPKLKIKGTRIPTTIPHIYYPEYTVENIDRVKGRSVFYDQFKAIRDKFDFVVFHHARHVWHPDTVARHYLFADKGNDKVIKGFAELVNKDKVNACLILFEFDDDVQLSKKLIEELGITDNVFWFPRMPRKEIMIGLSCSDIAVGEIAHPWVTYGIVLEAMVAAKPIIMNRDEELIRTNYNTVYPIAQAVNEVDVYKALKHYYSDKAAAVNDGELCRQWFMKNIVDKSLGKIIEIIEEK